MESNERKIQSDVFPMESNEREIQSDVSSVESNERERELFGANSLVQVEDEQVQVYKWLGG